jgi:hypothetical protein
MGVEVAVAHPRTVGPAGQARNQAAEAGLPTRIPEDPEEGAGAPASLGQTRPPLEARDDQGPGPGRDHGRGVDPRATRGSGGLGGAWSLEGLGSPNFRGQVEYVLRLRIWQASSYLIGPMFPRDVCLRWVLWKSSIHSAIDRCAPSGLP